MCRALSHKFGVVQAHRTSSNPLKTHDIRESKVCRVLLHKFGEVQAQRTSSNPSKHMADRARCVELCHISSGWFKNIEPHRTPSKRMILKGARCVEFCHISSGLFKHIKFHRTLSKRMILERARCVQFCHIRLGWFKHIKPHRTSSKRMICTLFPSGSTPSNLLEPSRTTSVQRKKGV